MRKRRTTPWLCLLFVLSLLGTGCNRQDTECLARIGQKSIARTADLTGNFRDTLANLLYPTDQKP
jgi:hypothetical protein